MSDTAIASVDEIFERIGRQLMGSSPLHDTARTITRLLEDEGVEYAVAGALSLAAHGLVRATEDVDILLTRDGLAHFKQQWLGRGYVELRPGGKAVRDVKTRVKIDFLIAGDFPGDGLPKPVAFPEPSQAGERIGDGYRVLSLPRLMELKLASGMTAPHRLQDLADVLRLIEVGKLPRDTAARLDPWVREKFDELWRAAQHPEDDY